MKTKKTLHIYLITYLLLFTVYIIYWSFYVPIPEIQFGSFGPRYKRNIPKFEQFIYLEKLKINFSERNFFNVYSFASHYKNSSIINEAIEIAKNNNMPDYKLLPFIFYYGYETPEGKRLLQKIDLNNKYNKNNFIYLFCMSSYLHDDIVNLPIIQQKKLSIGNNYNCPENFIAPEIFTVEWTGL